jgi:hypothetical protein
MFSLCPEVTGLATGSHISSPQGGTDCLLPS